MKMTTKLTTTGFVQQQGFVQAWRMAISHQCLYGLVYECTGLVIQIFIYRLVHGIQTRLVDGLADFLAGLLMDPV